MKSPRRILRGAVVAFVPFLILLAWFGDLVWAAIVAIPALILGARIERDGDWSSPRRIAALFLAALLMAVAIGGWGELYVVLVPVLGVIVWLVAGPGPRVRTLKPPGLRLRRPS